MDGKAQNNRGGWKQDPDRVRSEILTVARIEFAANGLSGARIDEIAAKTSTSKRMIYYYFGDKESLYRHALEAAYEEVRSGEQALELDHLEPVEALEQLAAFTFEHHRKHPDFIRMVMIENIHDGAFMRKSDQIQRVNAGAIQKLENICRRGREAGLFRADISALELHWHISALSFFNVSNRATFSGIFGPSLFGAEGQRSIKRHMIEMIMAVARKPPKN
jgi:AcrR family transcriptional regulator